MVEGPHDLDLLDETLLPLVFTVGCLLGKGLHRIVFVVLDLLSQVDRREVAFPDFLLGFVLLMEASLVDPVFEDFPPLSQVGGGLELEGLLGGLLLEEDGRRTGDKAELEFEVEGHVLFALGGRFDEAVLVDGDRDVAFLLFACGGGHQQSAHVSRSFLGVQLGNTVHTLLRLYPLILGPSISSIVK